MSKMLSVEQINEALRQLGNIAEFVRNKAAVDFARRAVDTYCILDKESTYPTVDPRDALLEALGSALRLLADGDEWELFSVGERIAGLCLLLSYAGSGAFDGTGDYDEALASRWVMEWEQYK